MRHLLLALCLAFAGSTIAGCGGGASIPTPPADAKAGPPPGTSSEMTVAPKKADPKKK